MRVVERVRTSRGVSASDDEGNVAVWSHTRRDDDNRRAEVSPSPRSCRTVVSGFRLEPRWEQREKQTGKAQESRVRSEQPIQYLVIQTARQGD